MRMEKIGEDKGKVLGFRILDTSPDVYSYEVTYKSQGSLLGMEFEDYGTQTGVSYPNGREYGEGHGVTTTRDGDVLSWHASGLAKSVSKGYGSSYRGVLFFQSQSSNADVQRLCKSPILIEFESDEEGNSRTTYYEWQ